MISIDDVLLMIAFLQKCKDVPTLVDDGDKIDLHNCMKLFTEPEVLAPQEAW